MYEAIDIFTKEERHDSTPAVGMGSRMKVVMLGDLAHALLVWTDGTHACLVVAATSLMPLV